MAIWGAIAKGALNLGKKIISNVKAKKEKKVAKAAEKLIKKKEQLAAANEIANEAGFGAGVSQFAGALNIFKEATGQTPVSEDKDLKDDAGKGDDKKDLPAWVWPVAILVAILVLPKLLRGR